MTRSGRATRARLAIAVLLGAAACAAAIALPASAQLELNLTVDVSSTGLNAERIKTIPIAKRSGAKKRVAMSLGPSQIGPILPGDAVWAGAEVEVSVTCLEPMRQCVGRIYHFSPVIRAQLVLADDENAAGANTTPISEPKRLQCSQKLPNRNHHCVLALDGLREVKPSLNLPCVRCHVNLVVEAVHPAAKKRHVVVVGTDSDGGRIKQDKGMLNAAVVRPGPFPAIAPEVTQDLSSRRLPVAPQYGGGKKKKTIVISKRLGELREHEQLIVDARAKVKTKHLGYGALLQSQLLLTERPLATSNGGVAAKVASAKGKITALNGLNCTKGRSGHKSPCAVRKIGVVRMLSDARARPGREDPGPFVPLYVNLIMQSQAQFGGHRHRAGDAAKILSGSLEVTRFGPGLRF